MWVTSPREHPYHVEWLRFEPDSPVTGPLRTEPHVAYRVDDVHAAIEGLEVLAEPFDVGGRLPHGRVRHGRRRGRRVHAVREPRRGGVVLSSVEEAAKLRDPRRDEDLRGEDRPRPRTPRLLARHHRRRTRLHSRAERLREDDAALGDVGAARPDARRDPARRHARHRAPTRGDRDDVPGREPAALAQPAQEHRVSVRDQEATRRRRSHRDAARGGRAGRLRRAPTRASCRAACSSAPRSSALSRPTPACC